MPIENRNWKSGDRRFDEGTSAIWRTLSGGKERKQSRLDFKDLDEMMGALKHLRDDLRPPGVRIFDSETVLSELGRIGSR